MNSAMKKQNINRKMNLGLRHLQLAALGMSAYLFLIIWPAIDLVRMHFAADPNAFSINRLFTALSIAVVFGFYAQWQMKRLVNFQHQ